MAVVLDHPFTTERSLDDVEAATVLEHTGPESAKAEIKVKRVVSGVLDALVKDFAGKLGKL
jgi:hypothetical protein